MPRPRTGTTFLKHGIRQVAITTDRSKAHPQRWVKPCPGATESDARLAALDLQRQYDRGEWDPWATAPTEHVETLTVEAWCKEWVEARRARGLVSADLDPGTLTAHVLPVIGALAIRTIAKRDVERLVASLDARVRAGEIAWKTATNVWGLATRMFLDASRSKDLALRVRDDDPSKGVAPPDRGARRARAYLYPSEFLQLVSCESISIVWRRTFALSVYLYVRRNELRALTWADVDLDRGVAHVHAALDRKTGATRRTKTGSTRRVPIEPTLLPLLRAMRAETENPAACVLRVLNPLKVAARLRECLRQAGVDRAELFAHDETRAQIDFHDLRATGITWAAVRGDDPLKIERRAGHVDLKTTERYIREAENLGGGFGEVFPHLPACLLGLATGSATEAAPDTTQQPETSRSHTGPPGLAPGSDVSLGREESQSGENHEAASRSGDHSRRLATDSATEVALPDGPSPYAGEASLWAWFERAELERIERGS